MLKFYGIKNCNSVKKAMDYLNSKQIEFEFLDIKKLDEETLDFWLSKRSVLELVNTAGMSARKLGLNKEKLQNLNQDEIKAMILESPTLIKRPLIVKDDEVFIAKEYESF
ncbi:Spx/MgsR family RNA polymerase-binding regulatory protein [Campylobacter sp. LMG 7929]|uniref:Spx/MgsR family RNA polymerase-binding regulatory protein n=1 Tax=Campylobacter TaxID=194 RepID=UPI001418BD90|nr:MULTISPECIES: Spx/MgsR family RNA polymerase-binding regulatory protein [Campylobacter]MCR8697281.1 Spx/MgsR family RNA polymerase-binding regulatory protein [Campylobacter sp. LMG 7929]MCR8704566.1 Spx/MgsR family RNA polymerase-binding regulatory protein [Campylobacter sp. 2352 PW]EAH4571664.1 Spx/MgsR family RNA polymerase-binding regulatory protein [Campylobacter lari]EAH6868172.1 Spx/MgsR family RNA polymerase-binding regulatory protein [Campylobacter lari]EAK3645722.1 Spx/MgsR family 